MCDHTHCQPPPSGTKKWPDASAPGHLFERYVMSVHPVRADDGAAEALARMARLHTLGELTAAQAEILHTALRTQLAAVVVLCGFRTQAEKHQHGGSQPDAQTPECLPARERSG